MRGCQRVLTLLGRSVGCLLELDERRVLAQVESEQHAVRGIQLLAGEVALGLLRLDAAQGGELGLALGDFQDGLGALLPDLVAKQTESKGAIMLSRGPDTLGAGVQAVKRAREARQEVVHFERLDKLEYTRHVLAVVGQHIVAETVRRE